MCMRLGYPEAEATYPGATVNKSFHYTLTSSMNFLSLSELSFVICKLG